MALAKLALSNAVSWVVHATLPPPQRQNGRSRTPSRSVWYLAGTTSVEAVSSRLTPPSPNPARGLVTENSTRNEVTTTKKKGKISKSAPNVRVGPKHAPVTKLKKTHDTYTAFVTHAKGTGGLYSTQPTTRRRDLQYSRQPPS